MSLGPSILLPVARSQFTHLFFAHLTVANVNMTYHAPNIVLRYSELFENNCDEVSVDVLCIGNII